MSRKRPFGVTLLLWLVLSLSVWGAVRFLGVLRWWNVLNEFGARLSPLYLSITGLAWIGVAFMLLWGLFRAKRWARQATLISIFLWLMEYWIERLFFESARANFEFAAITSMLLLAVTFIIAFHQKTKRFFIRSEAHEQPNEYSESTRA